MGKKQLNFSAPILGTVALALGFLFFHLWSFDYKIPDAGGPKSGQPDDEPYVSQARILSPDELPPPMKSAVPRAEAAVRLEQSGKGPGSIINADLQIRNVGERKISLIETVPPVPLYEINLRFISPGGVKRTLPLGKGYMDMFPKARPHDAVFVSNEDAIVELLPNSAVSRIFPISQYFDTKNPGTYELDITYHPRMILDMQPDLANRGLLETRLVTSARFEITEPPKEVPPPTEKVTPAVEPAAGTPP